MEDFHGTRINVKFVMNAERQRFFTLPDAIKGEIVTKYVFIWENHVSQELCPTLKVNNMFKF